MNTDLKPEALKKLYEPKKQWISNQPDRQLDIARFSPCGKILAAGAFDGTVRRWELGEKEVVEWPKLTGHHGWVTALVFGPSNGRLYSADSWGQIAAWDYQQREPKLLWSV